MLPDFPSMLPTDGQLPAIWDCPDFFPTMSESPTPVLSSPTSYEMGMNYAQQSPGSYEPEMTIEQEPGLGESNHSLNPANQITNSSKRTRVATGSDNDERKRRRMASNRLSARRSRMRKQRHLENLTNQLNRLRMENRFLSNQSRFILHQCHQVKMDNERLRLEHVALSQRLAETRRVLTIRQTQEQFSFGSSWPCSNNNAHVASGQIPSLITY